MLFVHADQEMAERAVQELRERVASQKTIVRELIDQERDSYRARMELSKLQLMLIDAETRLRRISISLLDEECGDRDSHESPGHHPATLRQRDQRRHLF